MRPDSTTHEGARSFFRTWTLLSLAYFVVRIGVSYGVYGSPMIGSELWVGLAAVPLFQAAMAQCLEPEAGTTSVRFWLLRTLRTHSFLALVFAVDLTLLAAGWAFAAPWATLGSSQTLADYYYALKMLVGGAVLLVSTSRSCNRPLRPTFSLLIALGLVVFGIKHLHRWAVTDAFYGVGISLVALAGVLFQTRGKSNDPDVRRLCRWVALLLLPSALIAAASLPNTSQLSPVWTSAMMGLVLMATTGIGMLLHPGRPAQFHDAML